MICKLGDILTHRRGGNPHRPGRAGEAQGLCRFHEGVTVTVTGISKGAGMIRPNMATMLGYINHLTPRTLDIDQVQAALPGKGITPKAVIEGPPRRQCPILLRQTSFKALDEAIDFTDAQGK